MGDPKENEVLYETLQQQLASANASAEAAEVHGVICGAIATNLALSENWFKDLFDHAEEGDLLVEECQSSIKQLHRQMLIRMESGEMAMQLLLPEDQVALPSRAQAVTEWCQGFLYALGLAGDLMNQLSPEVSEAIEDIAELSQLDVSSLGDDANSEEEEAALNELTEFLWVAAMLVYDTVIEKKSSFDHYETNHEYH